MKYSLRNLMSERAKTIVFWIVFVIPFVVASVLSEYCIREMGLEEVFKRRP